MQVSTIGVVRGSQELVLEPACERAQAAQRAFPSGVSRTTMATAVARVAPALDEAALLELVEQPDQLAAIVAQRIGDGT